MKYFFSEQKLVFLALEADHEHSDSLLDGLADHMATSGMSNVEAKKIADSHNDLRAKFKDVVKEGILSKNEETHFQYRIEGATSASMEGMRRLANEFQRLVEQARDLVKKYEYLVNKDSEYFVYDPSRNLDGKQEFIDEFRRDSDIKEKIRRMDTLDPLVKERRAEIAELEEHGYTREELRKKRSSEMKKEFLKLTKAKKEYEQLFNANKKYFAKSTIDKYLVEFDDLTLTERQERIKNFDKDLLEGNSDKKGRKKLFDEFKELQRGGFLKDPNTGRDIISEQEFTKARRREKQEMLKNLAPQLDARFETRITNLENKDMSPYSKQYAIASFKLIKDSFKKAQRIQFMEKAIEGELKLTKKYEKIPEKDRKKAEQLIGYEKWETLSYEAKEKTLERMPQDIKVLKEVESKLAKGVKEGIIAEKTQKRFMENFTQEWDFDRRQKEASENVFDAGMNERSKEYNKFYDEKIIRKEVRAKFEKEFKDASITRRKEIVLEAQKEQQKLNAQLKEKEATTKTEEQTTTKVETKEEMRDANILILSNKAAQAEASKDYQKAIFWHEAVLAIDPYNAQNQKKIDELRVLSEKQDEQKMEREIRRDKLNQEIGKLTALQALVDEQETIERQAHGSTDKANQDSHHLDAFDKMLHARLTKHGKVLGREHSGIRKAENLLTIKNNLTEAEMATLRREVSERGISDKPRVNIEIRGNDGQVKKAEHGHSIVEDRAAQISTDLEKNSPADSDDAHAKNRRKKVAQKVVNQRLEQGI